MDLEYTGWPLIELGHGKIEVAEGTHDDRLALIELGHGKIEVAEGTHDDRLALIFGRNGTGKVGEATPPNRRATHEETLAVVTFANVESLDVVLAKLQTLRQKLTASAELKETNGMSNHDKRETAALAVGTPLESDQLGAWLPIATAPRDGTPIVGWCVHAADPYYLEGTNRLTIYGGHTEGLSHVEDGPHVVVWGGAFDDSTWEAPGACMPDWWFQHGSSFEVTANPTHWIPLPPPPQSA